MNNLILQNDRHRVEIAPENGAIIRLFDRVGDIELITEPRLAGNYMVLLPLPDLQGNYIIGSEQTLTEGKVDDDSLVLRWDGPLTSGAGAFDLTVTMTIRQSADGLTFDTTVENRSDYELAEVWHPILGGINGVGDRRQTRAMIPASGPQYMADETIFQNFTGFYYGNPIPEKSYPYPGQLAMPWCDLYNPELGRGVYFACCEAVDRTRRLRFALHPGMGYGRADNWPRPDDVTADVPIGLEANWVNFPYTPSGETFVSPTVHLAFHDGDWHQAAPMYRDWFTSTYKLNEPTDDWLRQELAFQWIILMLPEGQILWRYEDIPQLAQDALDAGFRTLLISGYDRGGHDSGYPYYEPDPRLGTWDDLAAAVKKAQALGAKIFFFVNLQPVDDTTEWYRDELHKYVSSGPWGERFCVGYGMGTHSARVDYTRRPNVYCNPHFKAFRDPIIAYYRKFAEIGADGIHIDKLAWAHYATDLDFNPALETTPDRAQWEGVVLAMQETIAACRAIDPNFGITFEGPWDRLLEFANVTWLWPDTGSRNMTSPVKYTFPQWLPAHYIVQPFDYIAVNNAVRIGSQLFLSPGFGTQSMAAPAMAGLSRYIRELLQVWASEKAVFFLGEYLDNQQVTVEAGDDVAWGVHRDPTSGRRGCVLMSFSEDAREATVSFAGNSDGDVRILQPAAQPCTTSLPATVVIPAERLVFIVEAE